MGSHVPILLLIVATFTLAYCLFQRWRVLRKVRALGSRAAVVPSYLPLGLDFIIGIIRANSRYRALEYWTSLIDSACGPNNKSHTAELYPFWGQRCIMTTEPANMKAILATQFDAFGKGPNFVRDWEEFLGEGIFVVDGEKWHGARKMARPAFMKSQFEDLEIVERHTTRLLELVGRKGEGREFDLKPLLYSWTMDVATDLFFGESVGCLRQEDKMGFERAFEGVERYMAWKVRIMPFDILLPKKQFLADLEVMERVIEPYIRRALSTEHKDSHKGSQTFISTLAEETQDRKVIRDQIMNFLLAGRDTTAGTLCFCFLDLVRHPKVIEKLRLEIEDMVGEDPPTYQQLKDMKYLNAVINETVRLYPILGWNFKTALVDTTLPVGGGPDGSQPIGMPAGTLASICPLSMHRRTDLHPPNAEDPTSWSPDRWNNWSPRPWEYIPFSGGPRICLGQNFAITEMAYMIVRFLQAFDHLEDCGSPTVFQANMLLTPAYGVKIKVRRRTNS